MKMTINPQNWIDDTVEISINKAKKTVKVIGEVLTLTFKKSGEFEVIAVDWNGEQFTSFIKLSDKEGGEYYCVEREHKDPYALAAIMACNLI